MFFPGNVWLCNSGATQSQGGITTLIDLYYLLFWLNVVFLSNFIEVYKVMEDSEHLLIVSIGNVTHSMENQFQNHIKILI